MEWSILLRRLFAILLVLAFAIDLPAADFSLKPLPEERAAIAKIVELGGRCEIDDWGRVCKVNLAYSFSSLGVRSTNHKLDSDAACELLTPFVWLQELVLSPSQVSDEGLRHLGELLHLRELKIVDAKYRFGRSTPTISDAGILHLAGLTRLEVFHAPITRLTDASMQILGGFDALREIDMRGCPITDLGLEHISRLKHLQVLHLASASISARGLERIVGDPIRSLFLYDCNIGDAALVHIGQMTELEDLWLGRAKITDAGVAALADLDLLSLGLADTPITDDSAETIGSLTNLRRLLNSGTHMTEASTPALTKLTKLESVALPQYFDKDSIADLVSAQPALRISGHWTRQVYEDMQQIGQALLHYKEMNGAFPSTVLNDEFGKPAFSWRVAILPLLGEQKLFDKFRFDQPWNSEHNLMLLKETPAIYACKSTHSQRRVREGSTLYQAIVGKDTVMEATEPDQLPQGRNAIVLETSSHQAVPWTAPQDFDSSIPTVLKDLFQDDSHLFLLLQTGEVRSYKNDIGQAEFEMLIHHE